MNPGSWGADMSTGVKAACLGCPSMNEAILLATHCVPEALLLFYGVSLALCVPLLLPLSFYASVSHLIMASPSPIPSSRGPMNSHPQLSC